MDVWSVTAFLRECELQRDENENGKACIYLSGDMNYEEATYEYYLARLHGKYMQVSEEDLTLLKNLSEKY